MGDIEVKVLKPKQAQMKVIEEENGPGYIEGYAAVFNNVDNGGDKIIPGAFKKTIIEKLPLKRIKFVDFHNGWRSSEDIIGVVEEAKEDEFGLWIKARLSKSNRAQEVREKIKDGILDALSIGYRTVKYSYAKEGEKEPDIRILEELELFEASVVAWGMNSLAVITGAKNSNEIGTSKLFSILRNRMETIGLSESEKKELREIINNLKALLGNEPSNDTQNPKAAEPTSEPGDHSDDEIREMFKALNVAKEFEEEQAILESFRSFAKTIQEGVES